MSTNMAAVTTGANWHWCLTSYKQRALKCRNAGPRTKKVGSNRPGLVDFAIGLLNPVLNLPKGQVEKRGEI